ncbi:MAG: site-specific integrase [Oscillospiraceae bacterium]|nr:site-specific integrase [Oscillospiraceae bacterium]
MSTTNIYANLLVQFEKVFKHNRQGSYKTKQRYGEAFKRFLYFLAVEYRLERIANIAVAKAQELGREDYATVFCLARYAALRLHECFRIDTQTAANAVKTGIITIKGKGGLVRDVPINLSIEIELKKMLSVTPRGHKLFVKPDDRTHLAMQRVEEFIRYYKPQIQDSCSTRPLHFHGLRHTCAVEWYKGYIESGDSEFQARKKVAKLLGHSRDDVTKVYLASLTSGER